MARITSITKIDKKRNSVHDEVPATYTVFSQNGEKYFQIDTYGREEREFSKKSSQIIQLDKKSAISLIELLVHEFNLNQ